MKNTIGLFHINLFGHLDNTMKIEKLENYTRF